MDQLWLCAPAPAIKLWRDGDEPRWQLNPAAIEWSLGLGQRRADWAALADTLHGLVPQQTRGKARLGPAGLRWNAVACAPGWLLWLQPERIGTGAAAGVWSDPAEKLDLIQEFGRLGLFERNLRDETGRWDAHVFRLFGLEPTLDTPDLQAGLRLIHPDDRERFIENHRRFLREGGRHENRFRLLLANGEVRHLYSLSDVRKSADGEPEVMVGVLIDDSQAALLLAQQQRRSTRLVAALALANVAVWRHDLASRTFEFNDVGCAMLGLPSDTASVSTGVVRRAIHPEDLPAVRRSIDKSLASTDTVDVAARYRRPEGGWRHVLTRRVAERDATGRVVAFAGVSWDRSVEVVERERLLARSRATETELQRQQERLSLATRAAGAGIWERTLDGRSTYWSEQMYRLRGLDPADPRPVDELAVLTMAPAQRHELLQLSERHIRDGEPYERELQLVWPDGSEHWVATVGQVLRDEHGQPLRMTGVNWDITQRKLSEAAVRDKETAERASRAKSEFMARMSHELRTPLNAVLGFAELMERDGDEPLPGAQRERLSRIRSAGAHLLALIEDVLDMAALEGAGLPLVCEPVSLDAAIDDVRPWLLPLAEPGQITLHLPPTALWAQADGRRLRQILSNLLSNAVKYNRPGGEVWLEACAETGDGGEPGAAGEVAAAARQLHLVVRDTGRGLSATQLEHLFEPFNRLGAEREGIEGVGIGLTIVRHLVHSMGGRLEVHSQPDEGTAFHVWLPSAAGALPRQGEGLPPVPGAQPAGLELVYIEDNPVNVLLVEQLVALRPGMHLRSAPEGSAGIALLRTRLPDLLLVDMQLPDMDGFEVLRRVRADAAWQALTVIALSANAMPDDVGRARAAGFDDYWTKPIDFERFLAGLDALAARRERASGR
jgi:PAS domain S-box-containing protein